MAGLDKNLSPQDLRNQKRRAEYRQDESYRTTCIEVSRENYRRENNVVLKSCLPNLSKLASFGQIRQVHLGDKDVAVRCYSIKELASVLGYSATILYRWHAKGLIPFPIYLGTGPAITVKVFLQEEVRAIVEIIGEHQKEFCYYRKSDVAVTQKLFEACDAVRKQVGG